MLRAFSFALGVGVATLPRASAAQPAGAPVELSGAAGVLALAPSTYRSAVRAFDRRFSVGVQNALRATFPLSRRVQLGARFGWLWVSAPYGESVDVPAPENTDALYANVVDLSVVARFVLTRHPRRNVEGTRVHVDLEAGPAHGSVSLRDASQTFWSARVATTLFAGHQFARYGLFAGTEVGFQYLPWGAGRSAFDPVFAGFSVAFVVGGAP
ncbi:MAG: hypothetical protein R3A52_21330 [Polyangiales bacterium]